MGNLPPTDEIFGQQASQSYEQNEWSSQFAASIEDIDQMTAFEGASGGDDASTAVDMLQKIHERNRKTEEKQEEQMRVILSMKRDKMKLSEKLFELQKEDMKKRMEYMEKMSKLKEEQLSLTKRDIELRVKESEAQLLMAELGIMGVDLDKLAPSVRAYYVAMQQKILERRGIYVPPNSDT